MRAHVVHARSKLNTICWWMSFSFNMNVQMTFKSFTSRLLFAEADVCFLTPRTHCSQLPQRASFAFVCAVFCYSFLIQRKLQVWSAFWLLITAMVICLLIIGLRFSFPHSTSAWSIDITWPMWPNLCVCSCEMSRLNLPQRGCKHDCVSRDIHVRLHPIFSVHFWMFVGSL